MTKIKKILQKIIDSYYYHFTGISFLIIGLAGLLGGLLLFSIFTQMNMPLQDMPFTALKVLGITMLVIFLIAIIVIIYKNRKK